MNSRLDQDQDNAALTEIKNLQSDFAELKSRQSIGRALVKRTYVVQTANAFDLSAYSIPANTLHSFVITVTGDGSQPQPYGIQYSQVYNGGTDAGHRLSDYQQLDATGTYYSWLPSPPSPLAGPNKMSWTIAVQAGSSSASVYIKIRTMMTCKGVSLSLSY
ncbi:hypothetical protein AHiyo1_09560 [Arthrobacter sp. Hiyo1]|uniref:hypothetical protein n=1 Tax=Arthrobacter sp. Hiyo1 TaxID=1588020 RepID=UPI00072313FE|nr:hypothetical protein [Arthrobacter sp. Hiyo1]GAP57994.1 hypothetical protein AHiyo1_09560 [Arthrobacter sp. Hiyo1]